MIHKFQLPQDQEKLDKAMLEIQQPRHDMHNPFTGEYIILTGDDMEKEVVSD